MHPKLLVDIIFTRPGIKLYKVDINSGLEAKFFNENLSNLFFTRDQVITVKRGVVLSKMHSGQRQHEVEIMKYVYNKLGVKILHEITGDGFLEGGD